MDIGEEVAKDTQAQFVPILELCSAELDTDLLKDTDDDIGVIGVRLPSLLQHDTTNYRLEKGVAALVVNHNVLFIREFEGLLLDRGLKERLFIFSSTCDSEEAAVEGLVPANGDTQD